MTDTTTTTPEVRSFERPVLTGSNGTSDAWLFILKRPGKVSTFATIDPTGSESWPWDEWTVVSRVALVESGPAETLIDRRQNTEGQRRESAGPQSSETSRGAK